MSLFLSSVISGRASSSLRICAYPLSITCARAEKPSYKQAGVNINMPIMIKVWIRIVSDKVNDICYKVGYKHIEIW
jgi:hypothetical protein